MFEKKGQAQGLAVLSSYDTFVNYRSKEELRIPYEPSQYLYFRCHAVEEGVNQNGDYWPWVELKKAYKTLIGKGLYVEHDSDDISKAVGKVFDVRPVELKNRYLEALCGIERLGKNQEIIRKVETGEINSVSIGCVCGSCICSVCGKEYRNYDEICEHMNPASPFYLKNKVYDPKIQMKYPIFENYPVIYEICKDIYFTELSLVQVPADQNAKIWEIYASKKQNTNELIKEINLKIDEIINLLKEERSNGFRKS